MRDEEQSNEAQSVDSKESGDTASGEGAEKQPQTPGKEIGGRGGLDPTRYGDWEKAGRCIDF